jgi:glycosyltransferase involved in cell wall biosynthesis
MSDGVSVIICCYNSAQRLPETLRHLTRQEFTAPVPWEILIVVDRATKDDTWQVAESFAKDFQSGQLRVIEESRRGLGYARIGGMTAARHEFLTYIDDDNWVVPGWVEIVYRFFSTTPEAGALGGRGEAVFEGGSGPAWFPTFAGSYAASAQYAEAGDVTDKPTHLLWGASLSMRKTVFEQLMATGFEFTCTEKLGQDIYKLVSMRPVEDTDLCYGIKALGWRLYYKPELFYKHFLTQNRLTWTYFRRMTREAGHSSVFLSLLRHSTDRRLTPAQLKRERCWLYQAGRGLRRLAAIAVRDPLALLTNAEGSVNRANADNWLGFLRALFVVRGRYATLFDENSALISKLRPGVRRKRCFQISRSFFRPQSRMYCRRCTRDPRRFSQRLKPAARMVRKPVPSKKKRPRAERLTVFCGTRKMMTHVKMTTSTRKRAHATFPTVFVQSAGGWV